MPVAIKVIVVDQCSHVEFDCDLDEYCCGSLMILDKPFKWTSGPGFLLHSERKAHFSVSEFGEIS